MSVSSTDTARAIGRIEPKKVPASEARPAAAGAPPLHPIAMPTPDTPISRWKPSGALRLGFLTAMMLVFGLGGWAVFASISGAVVAPGTLRVEMNRQVVQHPDGGVVSEILVDEGDTVEAGAVLLRLDSTEIAAELAIVESRLFDVLARLGRLEAEQDGTDTIRWNSELLELAPARPDVAALVTGQQGLFDARRETVARETDQLRERQVQIREELLGFDAQVDSVTSQLAFIEQELDGLRTLFELGLTEASRVLALERESARLTGESGALTAQIAQARGRITEIELQIVGREATRREEAIAELRDLKTTEAELKERRLALRERLSRLDIRAPRSGTVLDMTVFTERAVIRAAEPILFVVPSETSLVVDVSIEPNNINQVFPGQDARLRFSAFNARTTPEIAGVLNRVAPDVLTNKETGMNYYTVEVSITEEGLHQLDGLTLVAGMPVEVFLQTGGRSPISYLMRPFTDYFARSLRED